MTAVETPTRGWLRVGLPFLLLRLAGQATEFAAFVVLARAIAPHDFGRLSVAFLVARYLGLVADWGASIRGARDVARGDEDTAVAALMRRRVVASVGLSALFFVAATLIDGPGLAVLAAVVGARGLNLDWLALGRERGVSSGASSLAQGVGTLGCALFAHSLLAAAVAVAAGYTVGLLVSLVVNHRARPVATEGAAPVRVDGWMLGSVLADQVTISADTFLLAFLRGSAAAGVYAAVYRIPNAWMTLVGLVMIGMIAPVARQLQSASHTDALAIRRRSLRLGSGAAVVVLVSSVPAYLLVPLVFGEAYRGGRNALLVLMVATAVMALAASLHPLYIALARDRDIFSLAVTGMVVNLAANAIAIPQWGALGAAVATLAAQGALLALIVVRLGRIVGHEPA